MAAPDVRLAAPFPGKEYLLLKSSTVEMMQRFVSAWRLASAFPANRPMDDPDTVQARLDFYCLSYDLAALLDEELP